MSRHLLTAAGVFLLTAGLAANIGAAAPDDKETAPDGRYVGDGAGNGKAVDASE